MSLLQTPTTMNYAAHDPLFQTEEPEVKHWFCPQHLPWVCLLVRSDDHERFSPLWVWFQVRTAAQTTMLHRSTIEALGNPTTIHILDYTIDVVDIQGGDVVEPHIGGLLWHTTHNMLGWNAMTGLECDGVASCKVW